MRQRWWIGGCVSLLLLAGEGHTAVFHDAVSDTKRTLEFLWMQAQEVKKYVEMATTAQRMVEQVKGTYTMIEYAAQNVENMTKEGNILGLITTMSDQTSSILNQVQWIGFNLDRTTRQFETLYGNTALLTTPAGRAERYRQMRAARMEMTGVAMQTQSIRQTFTDIFSRLSTLMGISSWASGQKALQQLQLQQQALAQKQQQLGLSMQAVHARLVAMEQAEKMVLEAMETDAAEHNARVWYGQTGTALLPPDFHGFMIMPAAGR